MRARGYYDSLPKNVLGRFGMAQTAYVMIVIRKELPGRVGEGVLMRRDIAPVKQWVWIYKVGKDDMGDGGMMRILGVLEVNGKWRLQVRYIVGVYDSLADLITRCAPNMINTELKRWRLYAIWRSRW